MAFARSLVLACACFVLLPLACAQNESEDATEEAEKAQIQEMTKDELDAYIRAQADNAGSFDERISAVAEATLGTAYQDGPLGEGPEGRYDQDPLVDFNKVDCVTYVEQAVAVAGSSNYDEMFNLLQQIRYKNGAVNYEDRNHFMISDWIANNRFCEDITRDLGVDTWPVTRTISRKDFFQLVKAPDVGQATADQNITIDLVPSEASADAEKGLPSPSLVVFVGKVDWLFSLHCGLYLRDETGKGALYHASSKADQVVAVDLPKYVQAQSSRYIGFTAYSLDSPDKKTVDE